MPAEFGRYDGEGNLYWVPVVTTPHIYIDHPRAVVAGGVVDRKGWNYLVAFAVAAPRYDEERNWIRERSGTPDADGRFPTAARAEAAARALLKDYVRGEARVIVSVARAGGKWHEVAAEGRGGEPWSAEDELDDGRRFTANGKPVDLVDFIVWNEHLDADDIAAIDQLQPGEGIRYGGDGAPTLELRRVE